MKSKTTGTILIGILAMILALGFGCFRSLSVEGVYPLERAKQFFVRKFVSRVTGLFTGAAARAENYRLRREVAALSLACGELERVEDENARLRRVLGYVQRERGKWLAAGVLSRAGGAGAVRDGLRVDKGSLAGVKIGAVVVVSEGLVGRVTEVTLHTSVVTLITDSSIKVACQVEGAATPPVRGILCGGSDELLVMKHLSNAGEVPPRSRVLTSGLGGVFPPGLEVGTLLNVRRNGQGLACEGEVLPIVEFSTLEDVFIRCAQ